MLERKFMSRDEAVAACPIHAALSLERVNKIINSFGISGTERLQTQDLVLIRGFYPWYLDEKADAEWYSKVERYFSALHLPLETELRMYEAQFACETAWMEQSFSELRQPALHRFNDALEWLSLYPSTEQYAYFFDTTDTKVTVQPMFKLNQQTRAVMIFDREKTYYEPALALHGLLNEQVPVDLVAADIIRSVAILKQFPESGYESRYDASLRQALEEQCTIIEENSAQFSSISVTQMEEFREHLTMTDPYVTRTLLGSQQFAGDFGFLDWKRACEERKQRYIPTTSERNTIIQLQQNINTFLNSRAKYIERISHNHILELLRFSDPDKRAYVAAQEAVSLLMTDTLHRSELN